MAAAPPFLRGGFRPFFLGGPAWAVIAITSGCALTGVVTLPTAIDALAWHRHEMLFGFVGAVIAGFLLTAIPNWTGRLPIAGGRSRRCSACGSRRGCRCCSPAYRPVAELPRWTSVSFSSLGLLAAREVMGANNRNTPVVGMVLLFAAANAIDYLAAAEVIAAADLGWRWRLPSWSCSSR